MDLFSAIVNRDGQLAGRLMLERSRGSMTVEPEVFVDRIAAVVDEALATGLRLEKLDVGSLLLRVMDLACTHGVRPEANFTKIVITIMIVEAMGRSLDPHQDILFSAAPYLVKRKLSDKAQGFEQRVKKFFGIRREE